MTGKEILKTVFGYDHFKEGQEEVIENIIKRRDVLGIMPTGAGKSICYQVPALMMEGITLVICPLISLMKDQVTALNHAGIHAAYINSSLTPGQIRTALKRAKEGQYKIIYVAPERLLTEEFLGFALKANIDMITVDEAHCISQWGQDFRTSYLKIIHFIEKFSKRPVISAFTATATVKVKEDIIHVLGLQEAFVMMTGFDRKNLYFEVQAPQDKDAVVMSYINKYPKDSGIIYCATRKGVEKLYELLVKNGILAAKYHAGLSDIERSQSQEDFIFDKKIIMIATNAFGMGIDKSNVRFVIHYNMPKDMESYYQEAGRAGRDGQAAECILLYSPRDVVINQFLLESRNENEELAIEDSALVKEQDHKRLKKMTYYCYTKNCLREYILNYFSETTMDCCENCSNCLTEFEEMDITDISKDIIGCISDCRGRYGMGVIISTLRGMKQAKLSTVGMDKSAYYGKQSGSGEERIKQVINQLLIEGYLFQTNDKYALLKNASNSKEVLDGRRKVVMKFSKENLLLQDVDQKGKVKKSEVLTSKGLELFEILRTVRMKIANEEKMPPYMVFSDKTLTALCISIPFTKSEMLQVSGVGEYKYEKYGNEFLEAILKFTREEKHPLYYAVDDGNILKSQDETSTRKRKQKQEFSMTNEMQEKLVLKKTCTISEFVSQVNDLREEQVMKRLTVVSVTRKLVECGYLVEVYNQQWKRNQKEVTEEGKTIGIFSETRISESGIAYEVLLYNELAQQFLVKMLWR